FELGYTFYNAFLVELADREDMGRLSGYGWGLGYLGGLLSLGIAYPFMKGGLGADNVNTFRQSFIATAAFFLMASVPTSVSLRERAVPKPALPGTLACAIGFTRLHRPFLT